MDGTNKPYNDTEEWAVGNGQLWHSTYDPYDPYCLQDAHAAVSPKMKSLIDVKQITPVLITQAAIFPQGRLENILLKGIDPAQNIVKIPSSSLKTESNDIPAIIGKRMASSARLKKGDNVLIRWRDKNGTFDAKEIQIADIFSANVPSIDNGQIWVSLSTLQKITGMTDEATLFITNKEYSGADIENWKFKDVIIC